MTAANDSNAENPRPPVVTEIDISTVESRRNALKALTKTGVTAGVALAGLASANAAGSKGFAGINIKSVKLVTNPTPHPDQEVIPDRRLSFVKQGNKFKFACNTNTQKFKVPDPVDPTKFIEIHLQDVNTAKANVMLSTDDLIDIMVWDGTLFITN